MRFAKLCLFTTLFFIASLVAASPSLSDVANRQADRHSDNLFDSTADALSPHFFKPSTLLKSGVNESAAELLADDQNACYTVVNKTNHTVQININSATGTLPQVSMNPGNTWSDCFSAGTSGILIVPPDVIVVENGKVVSNLREGVNGVPLGDQPFAVRPGELDMQDRPTPPPGPPAHATPTPDPFKGYLTERLYKMYTIADSSAGDCHMKDARIVVRDDGNGRFAATLDTKQTTSGDIWHMDIVLRGQGQADVSVADNLISPTMCQGKGFCGRNNVPLQWIADFNYIVGPWLPLTQYPVTFPTGPLNLPSPSPSLSAALTQQQEEDQYIQQQIQCERNHSIPCPTPLPGTTPGPTPTPVPLPSGLPAQNTNEWISMPGYMPGTFPETWMKLQFDSIMPRIVNNRC